MKDLLPIIFMLGCLLPGAIAVIFCIFYAMYIERMSTYEIKIKPILNSNDHLHGYMTLVAIVISWPLVLVGFIMYKCAIYILDFFVIRAVNKFNADRELFTDFNNARKDIEEEINDKFNADRE